jgi:hypothetical protein
LVYDAAMPDDVAPAGPRPPRLLTRPLKVVAVGLAQFPRDLADAKVPVVAVAWRPPAGGKPDLARLLAKLGA